MERLIEQAYQEFLSNNQIVEAKDCLDDSHLSNLKDKLLIWLDHAQEEHKWIFLQLFSKFLYLTSGMQNQLLLTNFDKYYKQYPEEKKTLWVPLASKDGTHNHSYRLADMIRHNGSYDVTKLIVMDSYFWERHQISAVENVVLFDDIIGSGTTLKEWLDFMGTNRYRREALTKNIFLLCFAITERGEKKIRELNRIYHINIEIFELEKSRLKKAFSKEHFVDKTEEEILNLRGVIKKEYENKIAERSIDVMGYKNSEALIAFSYNTPNNTLSIFWSKKENWQPLFKRDSRTESPSLEQRTLDDVNSNKKVSQLKKLFQTITYNMAKRRNL